MMTVKVCNINYKTPNTITKGIINSKKKKFIMFILMCLW